MRAMLALLITFCATTCEAQTTPGRVPPEQQDPTRLTLELLNDGPLYLKVLCIAIVYGDGTVPNTPVVAKCDLHFQPKQSRRPRLLITHPSNFHIVDRLGSPCKPYNIWEDEHHSTTSMLVGIAFMNCDLKPGMMTLLVADDVANNPVWVDAR